MLFNPSLALPVGHKGLVLKNTLLKGTSVRSVILRNDFEERFCGTILRKDFEERFCEMILRNNFEERFLGGNLSIRDTIWQFILQCTHSMKECLIK